MDDLEKEMEESRVALKASQNWTNRWADSIKEIGAQSTSFCQDWLNLSKQHGDLESDTQANACSVAALEAQLAHQETRMANLIQRLERAEVSAIDRICLNQSLTIPLASRLSLWSRDGGRWVTEPNLHVVRHRAQGSGWPVNLDSN